MATATANLYCDTSVLANFVAYGSWMSGCFATFGWRQTNDKGQVVWTASSASVSAAAVGGSSTVYTYNASTLTGPALRVGMKITTTGMTQSTNDVSNQYITALGGSGASATFTVANTTQTTNESGSIGTAATTAIAATASVYEIWQTTDTVSPAMTMTVKLYYTQNGNTPSWGVQIGTNGADGSGNMLYPYSSYGYATAYTNTTSTFQPCWASGDNSGIRFLMFGSYNVGGALVYNPVFMSFNRSASPSGSNNSDYIHLTLLSVANSSGCVTQAVTAGGTGPYSGNYVMAAIPYNAAVTGFGNILVSPLFPNIGALGNPMPDVLLARINTYTDGAQVPVTLYGVTHNYIVLNSPTNPGWIYGYQTSVLMRYE